MTYRRCEDSSGNRLVKKNDKFSPTGLQWHEMLSTMSIIYQGLKDGMRDWHDGGRRRARCIMAAVAVYVLTALPATASVTGAGATLPYPLFAKWAALYHKETGRIVNYQSIGSGGGIKQIQSETVDFGATERPLTTNELREHNLVQFPAVLGGVAIVHSIKGIPSGALRLDGPVLADIYLGKIKYWNDPAIAALNPGLRLPKQSIVVVRRSDGSGTTFLFSNYLSRVSPQWKSSVGQGTSLKWPAGLGGKGNEGVAAYLSKFQGAIGYIESTYAKQAGLGLIALKNQDGNFVIPNALSVKSAAENATWRADNGFYLMLTDQPGRESWPIVGTTFILMQQDAAHTKQAMRTIQFFNWAFYQGGRVASALGYVPLPEALIRQIQQSWRQRLPQAFQNAGL